MDQILFYVFAAVAALAGLLAVSRKNAVAAACWLVVMFFGLSAVYVLLEAYFVAAIQILVYAGAIMVLFLFVIMLLDLRSSELAAQKGPKLPVVGVVLSIAFTVTAIHALSEAGTDAKMADRVTAMLRLPAPPLAESKSLLDVPELPKAPPPTDIELHEVIPVHAVTEVADDGRGDRAYAGVLALDPAKPPVPLHWIVALDGSSEVSIGGTTVPASKPAPAGGSAAVPMTGSTPVVVTSVAIPGLPGGTVELTVQRGGLDSRAGGGPDGSPTAIGKALFEDWLLPFEIASLLLTGAIFGAVVLTKRRLP